MKLDRKAQNALKAAQDKTIIKKKKIQKHKKMQLKHLNKKIVQQ